MRRQVAIEGTSIMMDIDPNECPHCFKTIVPDYLSGRFVHGSTAGRCPIYALFGCTSLACKCTFIYKYSAGNSGGTTIYCLQGLVKLPIRPSRTFPDAIAEISSQFIKVYEQAHAAEEHGLDQVTGLGYRKALEFLVKDYLIKQTPDERESIEKAMLGNCIKDRITDVRIKEMAKRATWLGNDEAHYVRKWVDRDVQDMKVIIQLIVSMVEQEYLFNSYMESMPDTPRA